MKPLTRRQAQVLAVIQSFIAEHGHSPVLRDIGERVGCNTATVYSHVKALSRKGYVTWELHKSRTLRVVNHG